MVDLERIPLELKQKFDSESYFAPVNVATEDDLVVTNEVAKQLAALTLKNNKTGAGIIIGNVVPISRTPNAPGPELRIAIPLTVLEQPTINRDANNNGTLLTAKQIALNVLFHLHRWQIEGLQLALFPDDKGAMWSESLDFQKHGYQAIDLVIVGLLPQSGLVQVTQPTAAAVGLAVTLTNVTAGADIWYTTDGSFPGSGNQPAAINGGAGPVNFNVLTGTTIRWAAYKAGMAGSDVGQAVVTI